MTTQVLEVERKYDVDAGTALPDLTGVLDGSTTRAREPVQLVATYLDTDDLRLRAARTTLRHRTGGSDAGWHLKAPAAGGRLEVRSSAPEGAVPDELAGLLRAATRGRAVGPVAELRTTRTVHPVVDAAGRILVEVVDDLVEAQRTGSEEVLRWREWEAELVAGDESALDAVERRLLAAGATPSSSSSKLGRLLGPAPKTALIATGATGADVVHAHLSEQVAELTARDPQVRRDEPDSVHKMRVATRRLRSALATFRPLLDREQTDPLRDELRWLAGSLGAARDAEVLQARLRALLAEEPAELVLGPVPQKVDDVLGGRYRTAHAAAVADLDGERYLALLRSLDALLAEPAWTPAAGKKAGKALPPAVARVHRRLVKALAAADDADGAEQDELLHEARKTSKQLRYACESVAPAIGKDAVRTGRAATALQELLGEHQDSVVLREVLREFGAASSRAGQNGFTFGRLHALEQARADARTVEWRGAWKELQRKELVRWLT